ncbi:MAG: J domain-containing protein [Synergistaceae bacterium]|jgi:hypothetical protein|nr:J domain-containing protein [Synergistaceae bacterium]
MSDFRSEKDYLPPDFEELYKELADLRSELASLCEELEFTNRVVIPRTQTSYLIKVGALRVELLQAQVAVMKVRRRIALLRSSIDRGKTVFEEALNYRIEREFKEWDARLAHEVSQIENAKARFSSLSPDEDEDEIRVIFRTLCRKLNPDINPDQSDEAKSLWPSVYSAYTGCDLFHLKALLLMADDYPDSYDLPSNIGAMREEKAALIDKMGDMTNKVRNAKQHPAFEWMELLQDPGDLATEQCRLRDEIARMRAQQVALLDMQKSLEQRGVRR